MEKDMSLLQALIIGILQGLTEFFPVSSSSHLKLTKILLGVQTQDGVLFDLACHLGTLVAILYFLRDEILTLFENRQRLSLLFIALIPLIPAYFLLKPLREFASEPHLLGLFLILTGLILYCGQRLKVKREEDLSYTRKIKDVLWIGAMQSAALIPGVSRSASTISCATILGWEAKEAVRFSFLLSIPTILGGNCLELIKLATAKELPQEISLAPLLIGFLSSGIIGLAIVGYAIRTLEKGNLRPFAIYCIVLGVIATICLNFFTS